MFSNSYIFRFAGIMVIIVALLLAGAARLLKPFQDQNIKIEKIQSILTAANIESEKENAEKVYYKHLIKEIAVNTKGDVVSLFKDTTLEKGDVRPFDVDLKTQLALLADPKTAETAIFPAFILEKDGKQLFVISMRGKGLWGPLYGNIALKEDYNTIAGAIFDHDKETPGLGAEINQSWFEEQFVDKQIFNKNGDFVSIKVVKGGVENSSEVEKSHGVDAISGGTITSDGLSDMIKDNLEIYIPYIKKQL